MNNVNATVSELTSICNYEMITSSSNYLGIRKFKLTVIKQSAVDYI